ncbi:MAG TPA: ATP-binding protein [Myxococcota bacterium]|nr:ATP-binding protein [Myxococcota bacterium]
MTVRARLMLAAAPLAIALALIGALAASEAGSLGRASQAILSDNYRSVLAAQRMKEALERLEDAARAAASGHPELTPPRQQEERRNFESALRAEEGNITEPGEAELAKALRTRWEEYQKRLDDCLSKTSRPEIEDCYLHQLEPGFRTAKADADRVLEMNQDAMVSKSEKNREDAERLQWEMLAATVVALAAGLASSWFLAKRTLQPLTALGQAVEQFGRGDFAVRAHARGGAEIAQLAATFNAMADRIDEYRKSSLGEMLQAQLAAQATLNSLPDPVFVFSPDGSILSANLAAEGLFAPEDRAAPSLHLLEPRLREALDAVRAPVLQGKGSFAPRSFDESFSVQLPEGERVFLPRAEPVYEEAGGIVAATVVLQDVTRLRRFEELRNDLVSTVAHQFRTPLTSLRMAIHLCLEGIAGPLTAKQQDLLYAGREECERLQGIVEELLDLARLQSGSIPLDLEDVAAEALLEETAKAHRADAHAKNVTLEVEPVLEEARVRADPQRLRLVFQNLLENALHHTPEGGRVSLRASEEAASVRFEIADSGPGIPEDQQGRIFEKFYRGPGGAGGGAGLGLSIARDVVRAHGGEIGVDSAPGRGSTFWFTLPRARSQPEVEATNT